MDSRSVAPSFEQKQRASKDESNSTGSARILPEAAAAAQDEHQKEERTNDHPEGKVARPHRCNDRLEDVIQALFEGDLRKTLPGPARLFYRCLQSNPGEEPSDPFFYLKIDPPGTGKTGEEPE